jgi:hypothetical protein
MYDLPRTILVINIIRYTNNDEVIDILKEFFEGIPHIDITDYESNRQSIQYMVPNIYAIGRLMYKFYSINRYKLLDFSFYTRKCDNSVNKSYYFYSRNSSIGLPKEIKVDLATAEKLQLLRSV